MATDNLPPITVSSLDLERLEALIAANEDNDTAVALEEELSRATVVAPGEIPPTVVTMNSTVRFSILEGGDQFELTLRYPKDAGAPGTVSVLAPIGAALLGLSVGEEIDWPIPGRGHRRVRILDVVYQPERTGDLHR
jgi:regulator of nucleoside diphosphate kinase